MTLVLEKRGCDFFEADEWCKGHREDKSDVGNYRVTTTDYIIDGKDGNKYFLEFGFWNGCRTTHKITGKPLKHPKRDPIYTDFLHINASYENDRGCWGNCVLEREIHDKHFEYSKAGILEAINYICGKEVYTEIEFI